jgi:hypothetical protein
MNYINNNVISKIYKLSSLGFNLIIIKRFLKYLLNLPTIYRKLLYILGQLLCLSGCFLVKIVNRRKRLPNRFTAKDFIISKWVSSLVGNLKVVKRFYILLNNAIKLTS